MAMAVRFGPYLTLSDVCLWLTKSCRIQEEQEEVVMASVLLCLQEEAGSEKHAERTHAVVEITSSRQRR